MKQRRLSGGARFGIAILSWLLGLALFATAVSTALIADIQVLTSEDSVRSFVHQLMSAPVQLPGKAASRPGVGAPAATVAGTRKLNTPHYASSSQGFGLAEQFVGILYEQIEQYSTEELPITKDDLMDMMKDSSAMDYIADKAAGLVSDYYTENVTTTFEVEEIIELMEDNSELIEELSGLPVDEEMINGVVEIWENNEVVDILEDDGLEGLIVYAEEQMGDDSIREQLSSVFEQVGMEGVDSFKDLADMFRDATSKETMLMGIGICVGLMLLILLINMFQLGVGLRRCGYPLLSAGLAIIPCLLAVLVPDLWTSLPFLEIVRGIFAQLTGVYSTVFGLGLVLVITGIIVSSRTNKKLYYAPVAAPVAAPAAPVRAVAATPAAPVVEEAPAQPVNPEPSLEDILSGEPVTEEVPLEQTLCAPEETVSEQPEEAPLVEEKTE